MHVHIDLIGADLYGFGIVYHRYARHLGHPGYNIGAVHGIGIGPDEGIQPPGIFFMSTGKDELHGIAHALRHIPAFYHSRDLLNCSKVCSAHKYARRRSVALVYDDVSKDTFKAGSLGKLRVRGMMVSFGGASGAVPPFNPLLLSWSSRCS